MSSSSLSDMFPGSLRSDEDLSRRGSSQEQLRGRRGSLAPSMMATSYIPDVVKLGDSDTDTDEEGRDGERRRPRRQSRLSYNPELAAHMHPRHRPSLPSRLDYYPDTPNRFQYYPKSTTPEGAPTNMYMDSTTANFPSTYGSRLPPGSRIEYRPGGAVCTLPIDDDDVECTYVSAKDINTPVGKVCVRGRSRIPPKVAERPPETLCSDDDDESMESYEASGDQNI
jgi:hypothetical protein